MYALPLSLPTLLVDHDTPFLQSLLAVVKDSYTRSERDNDLIYHKEVPSLAALPVISPAPMVKSDVPSGLQDPQAVLQRDGVIFGELLAWGAKAAISKPLIR